MRFEFAYGRLAPLLVVTGLSRRWSSIDVSDDELQIRMGWSFQATIPRSNIAIAEKLDKKVISIGVHGWAGRWLVNGAGDRLVRVEINPQVKARVVIPVRLRELTMSVEDADGLVAALMDGR